MAPSLLKNCVLQVTTCNVFYLSTILGCKDYEDLMIITRNADFCHFSKQHRFQQGIPFFEWKQVKT